jgi:hypothetical protein
MSYKYGDDDQVDYYLRRIERVHPGYYNNFRGHGGMRMTPSAAEITNFYYKLSAEGAFYWVNDEEQERLIRKDKESYQQNSSSDIGFWGAVGGLLGLVGGLMFEENPEYDEDEYYEDEEDYY